MSLTDFREHPLEDICPPKSLVRNFFNTAKQLPASYSVRAEADVPAYTLSRKEVEVYSGKLSCKHLGAQEETTPPKAYAYIFTLSVAGGSEYTVRYTPSHQSVVEVEVKGPDNKKIFTKKTLQTLPEEFYLAKNGENILFFMGDTPFLVNQDGILTLQKILNLLPSSSKIEEIQARARKYIALPSGPLSHTLIRTDASR